MKDIKYGTQLKISLEFKLKPTQTDTSKFQLVIGKLKHKLGVNAKRLRKKTFKRYIKE